MVVFLLLIIACCLLFGSENTKAYLLSFVIMILLLGMIGSCMG